MVDNLLKTKRGNSCTKKASTLNKLTKFLNEHEFLVAVFSSRILFVSFITASKINSFEIFLTYDL